MRLLVPFFLIGSSLSAMASEDAFEQRLKIRRYLRENAIEKILQVPAMQMEIPITENVVYLWPRERMLLGMIVGNYDYPLDDQYWYNLNKAARNIKASLKKMPKSVSTPHDILYVELVEYVRTNFAEIVKKAEKSGLPKEDTDFLALSIKNVCIDASDPQFSQDTLNNEARLYLIKFPETRYRNEVTALMQEYRLKGSPMEFSLGYGIGLFQGSIRDYIADVKYLAFDFGFYKNNLFLALPMKMGYGTSEVKKSFSGDNWLPGDNFTGLLAIDFGIGYRFTFFKLVDVKPFAAIGFTMVWNGDPNQPEKNRPTVLACDFGPSIGFYLDIRIFTPGPKPGYPAHLEHGYAFIRFKFAYHFYVAPIVGEIMDGAFYASVQVGLLMNEYERVRLDAKSDDSILPRIQ